MIQFVEPYGGRSYSGQTSFSVPLQGRLTIKQECNNVQLVGQLSWFFFEKELSWYDPVARVAVLIFPGHIHNLVRTSRLRKKLKTPPIWSILVCFHPFISDSYIHIITGITLLFWFHPLTLVIWGAYICFSSPSEMWARKWPILLYTIPLHSRHRGARTSNTNVFI